MSLFNFRHGISTWLFYKNLKINSKTLSYFFPPTFGSVSVLFLSSSSMQLHELELLEGIDITTFHSKAQQSTEQNQRWDSDLHFTCVTITAAMPTSFIDSVSRMTVWPPCSFAPEIKLLFLVPFLVAGRKNHQPIIPLSKLLDIIFLTISSSPDQYSYK